MLQLDLHLQCRQTLRDFSVFCIIVTGEVSWCAALADLNRFGHLIEGQGLVAGETRDQCTCDLLAASQLGLKENTWAI